MQNSTDLGDPTKTPFVRFISGTPLYPAPTIYEDARRILAVSNAEERENTLKSYVKRGPIAGQYEVLNEATWFSILHIFQEYGRLSGIEKWWEHCARGLALMIETGHRSSWKKLRTYLLDNLDDISGWNTSWQKIIAERDGIVPRDEQGITVRVIGVKTLPETRIDFLTDQILWKHGFIRQFLELFSLFAITEDFAENPDNYPSSMKALISEEKFQSVNHRWHFMFFDRTGTVAWRPWSNACDPGWLAVDLLGRIVTTLQIDYFRRRHEQLQADTTWATDSVRFQLDYVLDSSIRLGPHDDAYLTFEGKAFRWIKDQQSTTRF
jgi:hypothetical protein